MAMGFLRAIDANLDVQSAGTNPISAVNPYAIKTMAEVDIDLNNEQPKSVELYLKEEWDFVITVCGGANVLSSIYWKNWQANAHRL